ncbi:hypothetical protein I6F35_29665 [Bradyrhizobium sp. BRP22]|uniref:hypothetical protein n=1 Tax=Bradyrhizobium sp. BRP22 TaxID=2793821 RepID=UPI001CD59CEB|nr:hypothetical protein [Bradyrhizobium sp. BRP22]MCA1457313.1 hypothetical protein [Bradyrhizobium sp. BRP22]
MGKSFSAEHTIKNERVQPKHTARRFDYARYSATIRGSSAYLMQLERLGLDRLLGRSQAEGRVDAIVGNLPGHTSFDGFDPADLAFHRTDCPGGRYCGSDRIDVARDAVGQALELAAGCLSDPFIELGDVATTEKGHKPPRQLSRRGEFRSLRKQVAEEQPSLQRRSDPDCGSNTKHSDDAWELSRSRAVVLRLPRLHVHACSWPIARRSPDFQYSPVAEAPAKLLADLAAGNPPRFEPCREGREKM